MTQHLLDFRGAAHPAKAVFEEHGVNLETVAMNLRTSATFAWNVLEGTIIPRKQMRRRLEKLINKLEAGDPCLPVIVESIGGAL